MKKTWKITMVAALMVPAMSAMAGRVTTFEDRDVSHQQRIQEGLQDGDITPREAQQLQANADRISQLQAQAMRDGNVSKEEASVIDHAQNQQSEAIRQQASNRREGDGDSRRSQAAQAEAARNAQINDRISDAARDDDFNMRRAGRAEYGQARGDQHFDQPQQHDYRQNDGWYYRWW